MIKSILLDPEKRQDLLATLDKAVAGRRDNPWQEVVNDQETRETLYTVGRI